MAIVTTLNGIQIGDKIPCTYIATSGVVGTFSEFGTSTADAIPITSSATPNGLFYWIFVGYDTKGRMKLIADRNIQHIISWDALNTKGLASASGLAIDLGLGTSYKTSVRLMTGGASASDTDNEWDKIIVEGTLNGTITVGDNNVWNWSGLYTWTCTSHTINTNRVLRGNSLVKKWTYSVTTNTYGFRPMLLVEKIIITKYLIQNETNDLFTFDNGLINLGTQTPTESLYLTSGFSGIALLNGTTFNQTRTMVDEGVVGTGRMFSAEVDMSMIKNLSIT